MKKIVLATDLGGTNLRMAAVNARGQILSRVKYSTPRSESPDELVETISEAVRECQNNLDKRQVESLALAVPGIIDTATGTVYKSPNLPELDNYALSQALEDKLEISVVLENDANAAAVGENWLGASKGFDNSIMVTLGTGVGGGIIIDSKVLQGVDGTAGEVGHINVEPEGYPCGCGSHGCVEQYSSASAVVRMAKEMVCEIAEKFKDDDFELSSEDVFEMAASGNEQAQIVFQKQGYYLGIMLAGLINTLNPEVIVIGGGASAGWDLFYPQLREELMKRSYKEPANRAKIVRAALGDNAGILGVAKLGYDQT